MMNKETPTAFGNIMDRTTGVADRKLASWIESFIEATENLDAPLIYRRWYSDLGIGRDSDAEGVGEDIVESVS